MIFQKSACIETLYTELPFLERFRAAKADGFEFVEFWSWTDKDLAAVKAAAAAAGWWTSAAALATLALVWAGGECAARLAGGTAFSAPGGLTAWRRLFGHY